MSEGFLARARRAGDELTGLLARFLEREGPALAALAEACAATLERGGKLLLFGHGGSAAQAQHLAAELVNRFERERQALAAIALTPDGAVLTSVANDDAWARVFARQIEALGRPGDLALAFSTSGRSANVVQGLRAAAARGLETAALVGGDGGEARAVAALSVRVPEGATARVQEVQLFALHLLCGWIEQRLGGSAAGGPALSG